MLNEINNDGDSVKQTHKLDIFVRNCAMFPLFISILYFFHRLKLIMTAIIIFLNELKESGCENFTNILSFLVSYFFFLFISWLDIYTGQKKNFCLKIELKCANTINFRKCLNIFFRRFELTVIKKKRNPQPYNSECKNAIKKTFNGDIILTFIV